jgi:3-oxoacyl-ACP reductase-like protein
LSGPVSLFSATSKGNRVQDFSGQVALVTGANKGLGKQLVRRRLDHGFTVYLGGISAGNQPPSQTRTNLRRFAFLSE